MITYLTSFISSLFFSMFSYDKMRPNQKKSLIQILFIILSLFPLFCISSFRYGVGNDYFNYANYFVRSINTHFMELGFDFLIQLIRSYTDNYVWMFSICSLIFLYFIYRAIYEQSINPTFSIFIFLCAPYFFEFFSGMRQMMAVSIFLYSIKYIKNNKFIPYIFLNLIGISLHSSAIVFIPIFFLYNVNLKPKICVFFAVISFLARPIIKNILYQIIYTTKYSSYFDSQFNTGHFGIVTLLVPMFIFIFSLLFYRKSKENDNQKEYNFYCSLMFIQVLIVLIQDLSPLITRIGWGFGI